MAQIRETPLPGLGVRLEIKTEAGEGVGVIVHRGGRRELLVYDRDDPDVCNTVLHLTMSETRALSEMLGASSVSEVVTAVEQEIEGITIDWLTVDENSSFAGRTIGEGMFRTRTGVSIVAVVRNGQTVPAPDTDFIFAPADVVVAVGTPAGLEQVRSLLAE